MIKTFFAKNPSITVVKVPETTTEVFGYRIDIDESPISDSYYELFNSIGEVTKVITLTRETSFFKEVITPSRQYIIFINKVFYGVMSSEEYTKEFTVYEEGFCEKYKQYCAGDSCRRNFKDCSHLV